MKTFGIVLHKKERFLKGVMLNRLYNITRLYMHHAHPFKTYKLNNPRIYESYYELK